MKERLMFLAAMLAMAPVAAAAVVAQSEDSVVTPGSSSGTQYQSEACPHAPGEFLVGYVSEEAFLVATRENVVDTFDSIFVQQLAYPEIKNDSDPSSRFAAEEAKRQELLSRPGVSYVEYDCIQSISNA